MDVKTLRRHSPAVDLWKFIYCWSIVFFHIYRADGSHMAVGRYAVDFFLLAAGVFFFRGMESRPDETPGRYIGRRFLRFLPWTLTAFIFAFGVIRLTVEHSTAKDLALHLSSDLWEALLVKMNGMNAGQGFLNSPAWTLSCMLLVETVMVCCFCTYKKAFVGVLLPVSLILGFGRWGMTVDIAVEDWIGFTTFGTLRTWLVYGCGYYCLALSRWLGGLDLTRPAKVLLTGLETLCHGFAILVMTHHTDTIYLQWCTLLAFFLALAVETSGHSLWNAALERLSPVTGRLGAFSLSAYLMHRPVTRYFEALYPTTEAYYAHVLPLVAAIVVCSLAQYLLVTGLIRLWRKNRARVRGLFINDPPHNSAA